MKIDRKTHPDARVVDAAIRSRRAVRAFKSDEVSRDVIEQILDVARYAPSNSNTQPWRVDVLAGRAKSALSAALRVAHDEDRHPPLRHMPEPLPEAMRTRQEAFGAAYYGALGVQKQDLAQRARVTARNFDFFDAPVGLIFSIDSTLTKFSWLDYGMFIQSIMVAARAVGLDTCPQVSFVRFQNVIAEQLGLLSNYEVVCGLSLGVSDCNAPVSRLRTGREEVEGFARFHGFES
ncbi:nitroreductase [Burkholderia sp. WSM2232]|uniref:nitroreductase n=1 Tax=Burkholderia sp. WSM2232 TaxID=944436 RepID=UPI0004102EA4|nr:nitroreductase [Burkholderia sp. WSM2232]